MKNIYIILIAVTISTADANAQTLDFTFNPGKIHTNGGIPAVYPIILQPDGKILIGGNFRSIGGVERNYIARLNANGSLDNSFNPEAGAGASWSVRAFALQPDGKIIIGGQFTSYNGAGRNYIARINADGSLDSTFNPGTGAGSYVLDVFLQHDGKILIGGAFTSYNGTSKNYIARLNTDGSLDNTFNQSEDGIGPDRYVHSITLQSDDKIIIGGEFTTYNGMIRNGIARLNADGTLDNNFDARLDTNVISKILIQPDGKILAGGSIPYNDTVWQCMRFNQGGSVDTSFIRGKAEGGFRSARPYAVQSDGNIFIGGWFSAYNGTPRNGIARLNQDGSVDTTFNPGKGAQNYNAVLAITLQSDGKILIGGTFTSYDNIPVDRIARLHNNGISEVSRESTREQPLTTLYPVPTHGNIFISTGEQTAERIDVATILGQVVASVKPSSPETEISLAGKPKGMYFVTVTSGNIRQAFKLLLN